MDVALILNYTWPESFREMYRDWDQVEDLQTFLDTEVVWEVGQEHTAAEIIAAEPAYDVHAAEISAKNDQDLADELETRLDVVINALLTKTNAEINTYVEANVTNIDEAQAVIKVILKVLSLLVKKVPL